MAETVQLEAGGWEQADLPHRGQQAGLTDPRSHNLFQTVRPLFGKDCFRLRLAAGNVLSLTTRTTPQRDLRNGVGKLAGTDGFNLPATRKATASGLTNGDAWLQRNRSALVLPGYRVKALLSPKKQKGSTISVQYKA